MKLSTSASLLLAFCLIYVQTASGAPEMKGVSKGDYLDLMETAVGAYSDEHLARYLADVEKNGVQEHGFPRLAANLGVLDYELMKLAEAKAGREPVLGVVRRISPDQTHPNRDWRELRRAWVDLVSLACDICYDVQTKN